MNIYIKVPVGINLYFSSSPNSCGRILRLQATSWVQLLGEPLKYHETSGYMTSKRLVSSVLTYVWTLMKE